MTDIYEARWKNAIRIATKLNKLLDEGYMILDDDGELLVGRYVITDYEIVFRYDEKDDRACSYGFFTNDKEFDDGLYTKIKDFNERFKYFKFVHPKNIKSFRI